MRYFLIDRVTELCVGERARGVKNITLSDEILHDHFPDYPIMPGTLIIEAVAQLGGFLLEQTVNRDREVPLRALLVQIRQAKFDEMAVPGDQLDIEVSLQSRLDTAAQIHGEVRVGPKRIARTQLTFFLKEIESERVNEQRRYIYRLWTVGLQTPIVMP